MEAKPNGCLPSENPLRCKLGLGMALIGCKQISKLKWLYKVKAWVLNLFLSLWKSRIKSFNVFLMLFSLRMNSVHINLGTGKMKREREAVFGRAIGLSVFIRMTFNARKHKILLNIYFCSCNRDRQWKPLYKLSKFASKTENPSV